MKKLTDETTSFGKLNEPDKKDEVALAKKKSAQTELQEKINSLSPEDKERLEKLAVELNGGKNEQE